MCPAKSMYIDKVNEGPIWTGFEGSIEYCVSPAVRNVLACSSLDGDTVVGKLDDRLVPEAVIARLISGTASSILFRSFLMAWSTRFSSSSCCVFSGALSFPLRARSSVVAAAASRWPRA